MDFSSGGIAGEPRNFLNVRRATLGSQTPGWARACHPEQADGAAKDLLDLPELRPPAPIFGMMGVGEASRFLHRFTSSVLFCGLDRIKKLEELLDVRNFQNVAHSLADPNQAQVPFRILPRDISADQRPDSGGIGIRDL
jgi:hypothetical protein